MYSGVCDCCDGSDENFAAKVCEDDCRELGKEIVMNLQNEVSAMRIAINSIDAEVQYGKAKITELENQQSELTKSISQKEVVLEELRVRKEQAEDVERLQKDLLREKKKKEWMETQKEAVPEPSPAETEQPKETTPAETEQQSVEQNGEQPVEPPQSPTYVDDEELINFKIPGMFACCSFLNLNKILNPYFSTQSSRFSMSYHSGNYIPNTIFQIWISIIHLKQMLKKQEINIIKLIMILIQPEIH